MVLTLQQIDFFVFLVSGVSQLLFLGLGSFLKKDEWALIP